MFALLSAARKVSNAELQALIGARLVGKERRKLNELKLVESERRGRWFVHELSEAGLQWCTEELAADMAPLLSYCIEQFGPERCMFESNFPVDKVSFSHPIVFNAFKRFSRNYSASERAALFRDTAVRAYRIDA